MTSVTTLEHVLQVLEVQRTPHAETAYLAAEDAVAVACRWRSVDDQGVTVDPPYSLVQAVVLRTARYLARRESPSGVIGSGELGPVRIASVDRDIEELEGPHRRIVFGGGRRL